jgi:BirA family biotin operon repressor/biotin-[acetyl-CoA-carboxylase] ligase
MPYYTVLRLSEIDSTNRYALINLERLPDRQIIVADRQSAGYGRLGRHWVSDKPGNLCMSMVLKPSGGSSLTSSCSGLTLYLSEVLCRLLQKYGIEANIRWPNDVMVQGRKLSGMLGEARFRGDELRGYVLGIGVNLNMTAEELRIIDQPATSLSLLTGTGIERDRFLDRLLNLFFATYEQFLREGFPMIIDSYSARCSFLGGPVEAATPAVRYHGIARGFTDEGSLVLEAGDGEHVILTAGDLTSIQTRTVIGPEGPTPTPAT